MCRLNIKHVASIPKITVIHNVYGNFKILNRSAESFESFGRAKLIIRSDGTHKKEMGPYKPQITNDDPSFHQVSFG